MDQAQLNDLKQLIEATVSQSLAHVATKDDLKKLATKEDIAELKSDLEDANLKLYTIMETMGNDLVGHEARLTKLESAKA